MEKTIINPLTTAIGGKKVKAFLLLEAQTSDKDRIINAISQMPGVSSVDAVSGVYDIIATVEGHSLDEIGNMVVTRMQPITDICRCVVCLVSPLKELTD